MSGTMDMWEKGHSEPEYGLNWDIFTGFLKYIFIQM